MYSSLGAHSLVTLPSVIDIAGHPHINLVYKFIKSHPCLTEMLLVAYCWGRLLFHESERPGNEEAASPNRLALHHVPAKST